MAVLETNGQAARLSVAHLGSRVDDEHVAGVRVRVSDRLQHLLVLDAARAEAGQRLTAATDGRLQTTQAHVTTRRGGSRGRSWGGAELWSNFFA